MSAWSLLLALAIAAAGLLTWYAIYNPMLLIPVVGLLVLGGLAFGSFALIYRSIFGVYPWDAK